MKIESNRDIKNSAENIFNYISNFTNFGHLLPSEVEDWKCTETTCSFKVKGMFQLGFEINEKTPFSLILIGEDPAVKSPFPFKMRWDFAEKGELTNAKVTLEVDINPMMAMMAKKPLQNLADLIIEKLDEMLG